MAAEQTIWNLAFGGGSCGDVKANWGSGPEVVRLFSFAQPRLQSAQKVWAFWSTIDQFSNAKNFDEVQ